MILEKETPLLRRVFGLVAVVLLATVAARAAEWQWSVPAPTIPDRRAFLWVPPDCKHVRGLVIACHNMLEEALFERPAFRAACAENDLGIVMIFSGRDALPDDGKNPDHPQRSYLDITLNRSFQWGKSTVADENPQLAGEDLQKVLDALAKESGYDEIRFAPLMPVGHSSAGPFVWHIAKWDPSRFFALMPFKTGADNNPPTGIPIFHMESEWFDFGNEAKDVWSQPSAMDFKLRARANSGESLYGLYVDVGSGHCNVSDDSIKMVSLFLKKVVAARIPVNAPAGQPVQLKPVKADSGWLLDPAVLGKPGGKPIAYADWKGDPKRAFWYLDREMAAAVQSHMAEQLAKQPQHLGYVRDDGKIDAGGGMYRFTPKFLDDAGTFELQAAWLEDMTNTDLSPARTNLSHSHTPILYRVNSGGVVQVGPNRFRVCPHGGPIGPQGNPWEPTLVAYDLGDKNFRPTERPAHANLSIINTAGQPQTLDFPKIPDQEIGVKKVHLEAMASSGLPVQYFVVSGPAIIEGDTLRFGKIPAHAKLPVRIIISAFQWGRSMEPRAQSAGPVTQEFFIRN